MAAFDYAEAAADAVELIAEFGGPATLRQVSTGADPWNPVETTTDTTMTCVDLSQEIRDASGTLTGQTRRTLYISTAEGLVPAKGDRVFVGLTKAQVSALTAQEQDAQASEIVALRPLAPGGVNVMWEADLGR